MKISLFFVIFVFGAAVAIPQDLVGGLVGELSGALLKTVEAAPAVANLPNSNSSTEGEEVLSNEGNIIPTGVAVDENSGLLDNLLGAVAEILVPFLNVLQDLLKNLSNALIGGLVSSLKELLNELINPSL